MKLDKKGVFHRKNGQFASRQEIKIHLKEVGYQDISKDKDFYYSSFKKERYREHRDYRKRIPSKIVDTHNLNVPRVMGKFVTRRYAYLFLCTCKVKKYQVKIKKDDGTIKEYDRKDGETIEHYVYLSSDNGINKTIQSNIYKHHSTHYPNHTPISIDLVSIHEGEILE